MAYALSHKTVRDKTTLYAIIYDKEIGKFWDEVNDVWIAAVTAGCRLAFTESSEKGVYTASATFTPVNGGIYQISVFDSADADYQINTIEIYPSKTETVLEVVNAVQLELRMPLSSALTDSFAKLILAKMNTILTVVLPDKSIFDHLRVQGSFTVNSAKSLYRLSPVNVDFVDSIKFLKRPDLTEIEKATDSTAFRLMADNLAANGTTSAPELYQIAQRDHGYPILEFAPAPDTAYLISYEIYKAAKKLTLATEYVPKPDVVKAGAQMLMLQSQGRDASAEVEIFNMALDKCATVGANTNFGDWEA